MKKYSKPVMFYENFLSSTSVAAGTCVRDELPKEQYKPVTIDCFSSKTDTNVFYSTAIGCDHVVTSGDYGYPPSDMRFSGWETAKEEMYDYIIDGDNNFENQVTSGGFPVDDAQLYYAWKQGNNVHVGPISISVIRTNSY